jgi:hypothetical protein
MPKLSGINHLRAVTALQKAGFMINDLTVLVIEPFAKTVLPSSDALHGNENIFNQVQQRSKHHDEKS